MRRYVQRLVAPACGAGALVLAGLGALAPAGAHAGVVPPCIKQVPPFTGVGPAGRDIPPWGFHTGAVITGSSGSYARAWGDISLSRSTISGNICQVNRSHGHDALITMKPERHIISHTHTGHMWGHPGNLIKVHVKVEASNDPTCKVGTIGTMVMFGSYNGVRSDSVQFSFPRACKSHDHTYHGSQVNAQVPPL